MAAAHELRDLLFGDCELDSWPPAGESPIGERGEPWRPFEMARAAFARGSTGEAQTTWRSIAGRDDIESRHVLQAWHFLRSTGVSPPAEVAGAVLGAVAEVAVGEGHDTLAAYADGSVRYINYSGAIVVIDAPVDAVEAARRPLLVVAAKLVAATGPWEGGKLPPLPAGHSRLVALTPGGTHFGQGPAAALQGDPLAAEFLAAATQLLVAVTS